MKTRNNIVSLRTCLYSNKKFEKESLIRLVKLNNKLTIDVNKNLLGRGYWLKLTNDSLIDPKMIHILSKRTKCNVSPELIDQLKALWLKQKELKI